MNYPKTLRDLIESYKKLPGIGEKTAERMALASMSLDDDELVLFSESLKDIKKKIKRCEKCNQYTEDTLCSICSDVARNKKIICVVEEPKNVILFEKMGSYKGVYHVLNGLISPLDGRGPDDINIQSLIKRVDEDNVEEVIIAVKPSVEGETTSLYIARSLEGKNVVVSKIAHGVPMGADIDYIDSLTLEMAIEDRKKFINK